MNNNNYSDPRHLFAAAVKVATPIIDGTKSADLAKPTPCEGFSVEQLLGHLVFVVRRVASAGRGENQFEAQDETIASDNFPADWRSSVAEMVAVWSDDTTLTSTVVLPWATMTGAQTLEMWASELTTHTWDLATATQQSPQWDDVVVRQSLVSLQRDLPLADRSPIWAAFAEHLPEGTPFDPPYSNATPVPTDAPMIDQLVAWAGRRPASSLA